MCYLGQRSVVILSSYGGATQFNRQKGVQFFLLVDPTGRAHCLLSNFALAKLTAKGEPQCENYLRAERWRNLSKISPVEQLHQGAAKCSLHHSLSIFGAANPIFSFLSLLNVSNQCSAFSLLGPI